MSKPISMSVIRRLPRYYRFLSDLDSQGIERISSTTLAGIMNITASQVRQDLNCFGGFGQQGYGYPVGMLKDEIEKILGLKNRYHSILLGAGNLGRAIAQHMNFEQRGFELKAVFDADPKKIGDTVRGLTISDEASLAEYCRKNRVEAAMLCIPKDSVEHIIDTLYSSGTKNFWNFSHFDISAKYPDAVVENVHLSDSLMTLCYRMNEFTGGEVE